MKKEKVTNISFNEDLKNKLTKHKLNAMVKGLLSASGTALCAFSIMDSSTPLFLGLVVGPTLIATGASGMLKELESYEEAKEKLESKSR